MNVYFYVFIVSSTGQIKQTSSSTKLFWQAMS